MAALACSLAVFLLLFPTNIMPLLSMRIFGMSAQTSIAGGILTLWHRGWVLLAVVSGVLVVLLPFFRFGILSLVLATLSLNRRPAWLGRAFRWAVLLDPWAMIDVFLLASFVGYYRLSHVHQAQLSLLVGGECFVAAAVFTMISRAALDKRTVWRVIHREYEVRAGEAVISCTVCDMVQPASEHDARCPRCDARLYPRQPDAMVRTEALVLAAFLLFFPANIFPMNVSQQMGERHTYTIFTGITDLFTSGLAPLGVLIFCTSIFIPFAKILIIAWCTWSVRRRSRSHLKLKTRLFRAVAELGRWSKTDPYTIVFFVPLMSFGVLASSDAGWGATAFLSMTLLSMFASYTFDPRLMWDAAALSSDSAKIADGDAASATDFPK